MTLRLEPSLCPMGTFLPSFARAIRGDGKLPIWVVDIWIRQNQKRTRTGKIPRTMEQEMTRHESSLLQSEMRYRQDVA